MEKLRAVVFDLDGTLLDTLDDLMGATNAALAANGLPPRTREEVRRFVGNGIGKLVERAVPQGTAAAVTAQVLADFTAYYTRHDLDRSGPYAGVQEMLHALWQAGCRWLWFQTSWNRLWKTCGSTSSPIPSRWPPEIAPAGRASRRRKVRWRHWRGWVCRRSRRCSWGTRMWILPRRRMPVCPACRCAGASGTGNSCWRTGRR